MFRLIGFLALCWLLGGCAAQPSRTPAFGDLPKLRLAPASLGRDLALQQRLQVVVGDRRETMDALLEVDAQELRLAVQALGQSALMLRWDGKTLQQQRADWLPPTLNGDRVLFDLQLVFWPTQAIRAALPSDWLLQESSGRRRLLHAGIEIARVDYPAADHAELRHMRDGYLLDITSMPAGGAAR